MRIVHRHLSAATGFLCCILLTGQGLLAQEDTLRIPEVVVKDRRYYNRLAKAQKLGGETLKFSRHKQLSDVLSFHTPVFIKSYGLGSLATMSFRGTGAGHTRQYWNGIPINSSMNGISDLALTPVGLIDEVSLTYGSGDLEQGSGALGGSIALFNRPDFNNRLDLEWTQTAGSFADYRSIGAVTYGDQHWQGKSRIYSTTALNDFSYRNIAKPERPEEIQVNAAFDQYGVQQDLDYILGKRHHLAIRTWYQQSDRQIPPLMTTAFSDANQQDEHGRYLLEWRYVSHNTMLTARYGHTDEMIAYNDAVAGIEAVNRASVDFLQTELKYSPGPFWLMHLAAGYTDEKATAQSYAGKLHRDHFYVVNGWKAAVQETFFANLFARGEWYLDQPFQLLYNGSLRWQLSEALHWRVEAGKNYRVPTLNDLYWVPGGNLQLEPETGWQSETGLKWTRAGKRAALEVDVAGYYQQIDNWILWQPVNAAWWEAQNVKQVLARGFEGFLSGQVEIADMLWRWKGGYSYTLATNKEAPPQLGDILDKQLIYVPRHKGFSVVSASRKGLFARYEQIYNGDRFITTDNSWYLPDFTLANFSIGKVFAWSLLNVRLQFTVSNVWDTPYQVIAWRAMPGRHYGFSLIINYQKSNPNE